MLNSYEKLNIILINSFNSWPISGTVEAQSLLNKGGRVQILGLKPETPIACAVEQLSFILERLHVRTIIKIELDYEDVFEALKATALAERV